MNTLKAIAGTIAAVAIILGLCTIGGVGLLIMAGIAVTFTAIAIIGAIFCIIREELDSQDNSLPPDP